MAASAALSEPEGHRNSDHARDLPIHESVLERTKHGRRGLSMPETLSTPGSGVSSTQVLDGEPRRRPDAEPVRS